jgi:hypothetical protein
MPHHPSRAPSPPAAAASSAAAAAASSDALALDMGLFEVPLLLPSPSEQQAVLDMFQLQQAAAAAGGSSSVGEVGRAPWERLARVQRQQDASWLQSSFSGAMWLSLSRIGR